MAWVSNWRRGFQIGDRVFSTTWVSNQWLGFVDRWLGFADWWLEVADRWLVEIGESAWWV